MGKKIDTMFFNRNGLFLEFPVYYEKSTHNNKTPYFYVDLPEYGIKPTAETFALLQTEVNKLLNDRTAIKWKPVIKIESNFSPTNIYYEEKREIKFMFDAETALIGQNAAGEWFNKESETSRPNKGELPQTESVGNYGGRQTYFVHSFIDDTPENRQAVKEIYHGMNLAFEKINKLFLPKNVNKTISMANKKNLLTAGTDSSNEETK